MNPADSLFAVESLKHVAGQPAGMSKTLVARDQDIAHFKNLLRSGNVASEPEAFQVFQQRVTGVMASIEILMKGAVASVQSIKQITTMS